MSHIHTRCVFFVLFSTNVPQIHGSQCLNRAFCTGVLPLQGTGAARGDLTRLRCGGVRNPMARHVSVCETRVTCGEGIVLYGGLCWAMELDRGDQVFLLSLLIEVGGRKGKCCFHLVTGSSCTRTIRPCGCPGWRSPVVA